MGNIIIEQQTFSSKVKKRDCKNKLFYKKYRWPISSSLIHYNFYDI